MIENIVNCLEKYLKTGERSYTIDEGYISFYNKDNTPSNAIIIQSFFLKEEYQRLGILTKFINYLSKRFDEIWFTECNNKMTCILLTTCLDNIYFINHHTGEIVWKKYNETYNSDECLKINNKMLVLKELLKNDYELFNEVSKNDKYIQLF
jgi:hypothetical protein